jgi:hypothetical protein
MSYDINQTFIIEAVSESGSTVSACTGFYTNVISSCSGDTQIFLGSSAITFDGSVYANNNFSASTISATTFYGDGSNLTGISIKDIFVTGGTYSDGLVVFTNNSGGTFNVTGFYTGATDIFVTGATYSNNNFIFTNNTGGTFSVLFNTVTGLTATTLSASTYQNLPDNVTGNYLPLSGGTLTGDTIFKSGLSAFTISATTYQNLPKDVFVTGGTYSNGTAIFTNNTGGTFSISGFSPQDLYITGGTFNKNSETLNLTNNTGGTVSITGFTDVFVTGGTYSNGTAIFTNNSGATFNVTGFTDIYTTASTYNNASKIATFNRNDGNSYTLNLSSITTTDTYVTGFTFSSNTLTIAQNENKVPLSASISTISLSGVLSSVTFNISTSGSISGATISGGTFYGNGSNLTGINDYYVTGGTFSSGTLTLNRQNGSLTVTGFTSSDTFTTGFTYSNNVFSILRNQGLPSLTATINTVTGWTVNGSSTITGNTNVGGSFSVTGTSSLNGSINSNSLSGVGDRVVQASSGGTITATNQIISAYISSASTAAILLENTSNWDINGNYIGSAITGTYQGQKYYNGNYFFEAVSDNIFIRLIRG